jgi:general secretion pathway protein L
MPADRDVSASGRRLRAFGRRTGASGFLRWWLGELTGLVPRSVRAGMQRRRMRPVIAFDAGTATLWQPAMRDGEPVMEPVAEVALGPDAATTAAAGRTAFDSIAHPGATTVSLSPRQTLRRRLTLPGAIEDDLKQALAYDLDRHTPFKAEELYFDAVVVERDAARGEIHVDLAAAKRAVVDQALQHAQAWGANVVAVVPDAARQAAASRLNLLPESRQPAESPWRRWQLWAPAGALAAIALPLWQKREHAIALLQQTDAALAEAAVSERLRTELDRLVGEYNFALERKFAFPSTIAMLEEITKLLPDDTWLTQMEMKTVARGKDAQRELLLRGESANAGRLISAFEESKVFAQAAPRSPTTKIQPGPGEIFDLAAQLRPLPPPKPVTLAAAPANGGESGNASAPAAPAAAGQSAMPPAAPSAGPAGVQAPARPGAGPAEAAPQAAASGATASQARTAVKP